MAFLRVQRLVDPGSERAGDDSNEWRKDAAAKKQQRDGQQNQDEAAMLLLNKEGRPDHDDDAEHDGQDARDQETGDDRHRRFALVPAQFRHAWGAHGGYHQALWNGIPLEHLKDAMFDAGPAGSQAEHRCRDPRRSSHYCVFSH